MNNTTYLYKNPSGLTLYLKFTDYWAKRTFHILEITGNLYKSEKVFPEIKNRLIFQKSGFVSYFFKSEILGTSSYLGERKSNSSILLHYSLANFLLYI